MLAQTFRYKSIMKNVSSTEIYVFLIGFAVLAVAAVIYSLYKKKRKSMADTDALLSSFIRSQHLTPRDADLLRELVPPGGFRRTLKNEAGFDRAVHHRIIRLTGRGLDREELEERENLYRSLRSRIRFLGQRAFTTNQLTAGALVKLRLRDRGLFTAEIREVTKRGFWVSLPHWIVPGKVIRKSVGAAIYFWDNRGDYEIHAVVGKVRGSKRPRLFFSHSNTIFKGRHPGGMGIETDIPVLFQRILEMPEKGGPKLHVLRGMIADLSVIGCEVISGVKGIPGSVYRFEFSFEEGARSRHWFIGRVVDALPEGKGNRLFIRFQDMKPRTREFINRYVCWSVNRGGGKRVSSREIRPAGSRP